MKRIPNNRTYAVEPDGIPTFQVVPRGGPFREGGCYLVCNCPKCGDELCHGGKYKEPGKGDGHRVSHHPDCWPKGYNIVEV